ALANFTVDYLPSCDGIAARVFNNSQQADSYIWNFGDGDSTQTDFNPVHFYPYGPGGIITLIAVANNGCNDTLSIDSSSVVFSDNYVLEMPNAISPNNDGNNDVLIPKDLGWFIDCFTLKVFNRWGQLIFESQRPGQAWDGFTKSGNKAAQGIYYYFVNIKGLEKSGFVEVFY
ncbi:MAG: gliding motility-associated C-terminal domain-containing protein, partial [Bacteroidia bacterium]|nr:gliding motility-associated C-terminal domain-containing protein [Bacteroidia bacterium]